MKFRKGKAEIELQDPNTFNIATRAGFEPVEEVEKKVLDVEEDTELEALKAQAKELGIRNAHFMKKETLIEKIAEAQKGAE